MQNASHIHYNTSILQPYSSHPYCILQHFVAPTRLVRTSAILAAATATFAQISTCLSLDDFRTYISEEWAPHIAGFLDNDNHSDFWAPFMASAALPYLRTSSYATFYKRRAKGCWAVNITKYGNMVAAMVCMLVPRPQHCLHTLVYPFHAHTMINSFPSHKPKMPTIPKPYYAHLQAV
jgi:hypothetical protein